MTFDPQDIEAGHLNRAWSKLVKGLSNYFLESCHVIKMAFIAV